MNKLLLFKLLLAFSFASMLSAQNEPDAGLDEPGPLTLRTHGYPISIWGEEHSSFEVDYRLSPKSVVQLQGFYDEYACGFCTDRFRMFIGIKRYISNRVYLVSGVEREAELSLQGRNAREPRKPRVGFIGGLGYDVRENLSIEAKGNFQLNNTNLGAFGEPQLKMPQVYTLGGKLKF